MDAPEVTVCLCVYKPGELLAQALGCLAGQNTHGAFRYEILVIDDEPSGETARFVAGFQPSSGVAVRYTAGEGRGISHARNVAIAESRSEWIAWFDQDQAAEPDWLFELYRTARETGADWVDGPRDLLVNDNQTEALVPFLRACLGEIREPEHVHRVTRRYASCTGNALARKSTLETTGKFDETILDGWEDWDYIRRFRAAGFSCWHAPRALVHHVVPPERLAPDFFLWHAGRVGAAFACRDAREWGLPRTVLSCVARLGQAAIFHAPLWAVAKVGKRSTTVSPLIPANQRALTRACLMARAVSYARKTLWHVSPRLFPQRAYHARFRLRNEPKYAPRQEPCE